MPTRPLKYYNQALAQLPSNMKFIATIFIIMAILIGSAVADSTCYINCMTQNDACLATCLGPTDNCLKDCSKSLDACNSNCD